MGPFCLVLAPPGPWPACPTPAYLLSLAVSSRYVIIIMNGERIPRKVLVAVELTESHFAANDFRMLSRVGYGCHGYRPVQHRSPEVRALKSSWFVRYRPICHVPGLPERLIVSKDSGTSGATRVFCLTGSAFWNFDFKGAVIITVDYLSK